MENNNYIILNPDYHFKVDGNRVLLYSKRNVQPFSASDWLGVIHPYQANLLCRFSELKTYEEHCKKIAKDFDITLQQAELMMNISEQLIKWQMQHFRCLHSCESESSGQGGYCKDL